MSTPRKKSGLKNRQSTRLNFKQIAIASSALFFLVALGSLVYFNFSSKEASAYVAGDFRSKASGNWNLGTTWERYNGSGWVTTLVPPATGDQAIIIQNGHTVTVTVNASADQVTINTGGQIIINSGITFTIANGTGTDLNVSGILKNAGTVTISASANIAFLSGGKYQHNLSASAGTIPTASWSSGSTCEIVNIGGSTAPAGMSQAFSHFTWNCPTQGSDVTLNGAPSTVTGNYSILSTGSGKKLRLSAGNSTLNIGGNFLQSGGEFVLTDTDNSTTTINITGNFSVTGGTFSYGKKKNLTCNMTVNGNWSQSNGTITKEEEACTSTITVNNWSQTGGSYNISKKNDISTFTVNGSWSQTNGSYTINDDGGLTTFNIYGNYTHTGGSLVENKSNCSIKFFFKKTGSQIFTASANTVTGDVDFTVNSGSVLVMGNNILKGRYFTLSSGGGIQSGSAAGITTSGATGNIQTSGTRSYHTGASYTYNGTVAQNTGNGLPSTVYNLTINNNNTLTLPATVSVSNILSLTSGRIITGSNELRVTNSAPSAVSGYSSTSYVVGLLKRSITGTGTYDFPVGTTVHSELISVTLAGATGFSNISGSFTNSAPVTAQSPLSGVQVNGLTIETMLNYGYWTLTPDLAMTGGTYTVTLKEKGYTPPNAGRSYCVLKRTNNTSPWQSVGTHDLNTQSEIAGVVTAVRSGLTSFSDFGIGYGEYLQWRNPTLHSGTAGQPNAIYIFYDVCTNVDAWVQLLELVDGASLEDIDHFTAGYDEAWQPFIGATANDTSSIRWLIRFKVSGTSTDTIMSNVSITAIDVDGDGSYLKEMIEANNIHSYSVDPATNLQVSGSSGTYRAISTVGNVPNIDSSQHQYIFQINYVNVNSFTYKTGAISTYWDREVRQNCLYFRFLLSGGPGTLPVKLVSFIGKPLSDNSIRLDWKTAAEVNNDYFTLFNSPDGKKFTELTRVKGAGTTSSMHSYSYNDIRPYNGITYYKLVQTDFNGQSETFKVISVALENKQTTLETIRISPNPFNESFTAQFESETEEEVQVHLMTTSGAIIFKDQFLIHEGNNFYRFTAPAGFKEGTYILRITNAKSNLAAAKVVCRKNY